jgi:hypothetical protein
MGVGRNQPVRKDASRQHPVARKRGAYKGLRWRRLGSPRKATMITARPSGPAGVIAKSAKRAQCISISSLEWWPWLLRLVGRSSPRSRSAIDRFVAQLLLHQCQVQIGGNQVTSNRVLQDVGIGGYSLVLLTTFLASDQERLSGPASRKARPGR